MDLLSFNSLLDSYLRIDARKTVHQAWLQMAAAQGNSDTMKEMLAPTLKVADFDKDGERPTDMAKLMADTGGGI